MACQKDVKLEKHHILNMVSYIAIPFGLFAF
jgi:hypothetical protein